MWAAEYEIVVASDIHHENLVPTIDWCSHHDDFAVFVWTVQQLCDKGSLSAALQGGLLRQGKIQGGPPDMRAVIETALDIAQGMVYLHKHDVVHGDLSSNNVMLASEDNYRGFTAKVNDFGLSRALGGEDAATKTVSKRIYICLYISISFIKTFWKLKEGAFLDSKKFLIYVLVF